jgi:hypothetical protein
MFFRATLDAKFAKMNKSKALGPQLSEAWALVIFRTTTGYCLILLLHFSFPPTSMKIEKNDPMRVSGQRSFMQG